MCCVALRNGSGHAPRGEGSEATPLDNSTDASAPLRIDTTITKEDAHMASDKTTTLPPVRVDVEFKERLVRYAASQERDVSWIIRKAITEYLDRREEGSLGKNPDR